MTAHSETFPFDLTGSSVHEDAQRLRQQGPAARVDLSGGITAWSVTRYDVLRRLAADNRVSRDAHQHWPGLSAVPADWPLAPFLLSPTVLNAYGTDHTRLRTIMEAAFTPARLRPLESRLTERVQRLLAELGPGDVVEVREQYAYVIAGETLSDLFGVPEESYAEMFAVIGFLLAPADDPTEAAAGVERAMQFLGALVASKRDAPGADLATTVATAPDLTVEERVLALAITVAGGVPSTTGLITNAAFALLNHPDQRTAVLNGEIPWSAVVDETLRFDPPVQHMPLRYAVEDLDLGDGVTIRRGDAILLGFGAVGRDPGRHGDTAATFDLRRLDKEHLAFGHGVHYCIGMSLGRLEVTTALSALFEAFPLVELAQPADTLPSLPGIVFSGKAQLPVRLRP
ncbi:cytochrome P450 [Pseudonocardia adelaidensis]|uniref:Cytochrome P450 n=1 Tax=Pseudonocardia adelaidensis TaxID=648754 RepID=A0ABP9NN60_9PSEU